MDSLITVVALLGLLLLWIRSVSGRSGSQMRNPYGMAFATSAAAGVFLAAGVFGYELSRRERSLTGTAWSGTVIWWEVGVGLVFLALAVVFVRKALRATAARVRRV